LWLAGWCLRRTTLASKWPLQKVAKGGSTLNLVGLETGHVKDGSVGEHPLVALGVAFFAFSEQVGDGRM
jgi:hypothetical protein